MGPDAGTRLPAAGGPSPGPALPAAASAGWQSPCSVKEGGERGLQDVTREPASWGGTGSWRPGKRALLKTAATGASGTWSEARESEKLVS